MSTPWRYIQISLLQQSTNSFTAANTLLIQHYDHDLTIAAINVWYIQQKTHQPRITKATINHLGYNYNKWSSERPQQRLEYKRKYKNKEYNKLTNIYCRQINEWNRIEVKIIQQSKKLTNCGLILISTSQI